MTNLAQEERELRAVLALPAYESEWISLYLGDASTVLGMIKTKADLLVTDPPYGIAFQSSRRAKAFDPIHLDQKGDVEAVRDILRASFVRLRNAKHAYVFGPPELVDGLERITKATPLIWDKGVIGMGDLASPYGVAREPVSFVVYRDAQSSIDRGNGALSARMRQGSVLRITRTTGRHNHRHPTEKPVALLRQLIESSSCVGDVVLDPFMGVGSTIVAARLLGRKAIGIEIDPTYFAIAVERVRALEPIMREIDKL